MRMTPCLQCGKSATGTAWQSYHGLTAEALSAAPVCEIHSDYLAPVTKEEAGRPYGYIPNVITKDTRKIFEILMPTECCPMECGKDNDCPVCDGKGII